MEQYHFSHFIVKKFLEGLYSVYVFFLYNKQKLPSYFNEGKAQAQALLDFTANI